MRVCACIACVCVCAAQVFNEPNELALLQRFFSHMREVAPAIYVTYNGDFFDWPFMSARANKYDMDIYTELGFK